MASLMIEVRRDVYMDEATGEPSSELDEVAARLRRAVGRALAA